MQQSLLPFFLFLRNITLKDMQQWRSWRDKNQQWRGFKVGLRAYDLDSGCSVLNSEAYDLCRLSDTAMWSWHLYVDGRLLQKHSLALVQAAPLPWLRGTELVVWRREFLAVAIERLLSILPQNDTCNSQRWDRGMGSKTISGRSTSWNLGRCLLECRMHYPDDYYRTRYS